MKKINNILIIVLISLLIVSCATSTNTKEIKYMNLRFEPLKRNDFTLVGNLEVQSVITGKLTGQKKVLDKNLQNNQKQGLISKAEATEILYFTPEQGEAITGSLYDNEVFNLVYTNKLDASSNGLAKIFQQLFKNFKQAVSTDPAVNFAYYELINKYPNIDYFINVHFDRELIVKGKKFTEKIIVKADGLVINTK